MREIKFRAWVNRQSGCMLDWATINQTTFNSEYDSLMLWEVFHNPNIEIMQFTGLHDKNGKEIYEGDKLAGLLNDESGIDYDTIFTVEWEVNGWNIGLESERDYVILGNIYEGVTE